MEGNEKLEALNYVWDTLLFAGNRPPLTTSITGPLMVWPDFMTSSIRVHARSY